MPTLTQKHCCQRRPDKSQTTQHLPLVDATPVRGGKGGGAKPKTSRTNNLAETIIKKNTPTSLTSKHTHNKTRPPYTTCFERAGGLVVAPWRVGARRGAGKPSRVGVVEVRPSRGTAYRPEPVGDSGLVSVRAWKGPAARRCATGPGGLRC